MSEFFTKTFDTLSGNKAFKFSKAFFGSNNEWKYNVELEDVQKITFHMLKDESGQWKIAAQKLPEWVTELEIDFSDAIAETL